MIVILQEFAYVDYGTRRSFYDYFLFKYQSVFDNGDFTF